MSVRWLKKAGVQTVVDRRGRVYVRAGAKLDRAMLRSASKTLTYVRPGKDGRRAHLRHLPHNPAQK